jgi:MFS family permease
MRLLVDIAPLRESAAFRRLWIGTSVSSVGSQFTAFAAVFAIWELTHSTLVVGALGVVRAIPLVAVALIGTAFIDGLDRARLARLTTAGQVVTALGLAVAAARQSVSLILVLAALNASLGALGGPARRALVPTLVPHHGLGAAFALNAVSFQVALLVGPALAGLVTAWVGVVTCFVIDAAGFLAGLIGLKGLSAAPADTDSARGLRAVREGFGFAAGRPVVRGALLADLAATVLAMPMALFPAINEERLGGSPVTLGLLTTAVAVGGVTGSLLSGAITSRGRPGLVMTWCTVAWGAALAGAGLATPPAVLIAALAVAGAADTWSVISRATLVQSATHDALRGRVSAIEQVVGVAGPDLGNARAGLVGAVVGAGPALLIGGLSCLVASGLIAWSTPQLRRREVATT